MGFKDMSRNVEIALSHYNIWLSKLGYARVRASHVKGPIL